MLSRRRSDPVRIKLSNRVLWPAASLISYYRKKNNTKDTVFDTGATQLSVYTIACLFLLWNARNLRQVLIGLCVVGFAHGGYFALMPSFTADYFGAKKVGANYGLLFTAWGVCGFTIQKYLAGIMGNAKAAGDLAGGYNKVYFTLAMTSIVGIVLTFIVKRPIREVGGGGQGSLKQL